MKKTVLALTPLLLLMSTAQLTDAKDKVRISGLTCNGRISPEGVENVKLGWVIESEENGTVQAEWEIQLASSKSKLQSGKADIWSSGPTESCQQFDIRLPDGLLDYGKAYWWRVCIRDGENRLTKWSDPAYFSTGIGSDSWSADWISAPWEPGDPLPYFRKEVDLSDGKNRPVRAMLYLCGLGCSELYFNGMEVDPGRVLDPAQTDYEKRALYSTFDVTNILADDGKNCIGVMLGNGWYAQKEVWNGSMYYGPPMLLCQINVEYADGTVRTFGTDDSWKWTPGPILRSSVYQGMTYDARREIEGWCKAGFDDSTWHSPTAPAGPVPQEMVSQEIPPMREQVAIPAVDLRQAPDGKWIYDFGVNFTGNIRFDVDLPAGTKLTVRTGEALNDDATVDFTSTGIEHVGYQHDIYICKGGGREVWTPRFTYHGFQYAELEVEGSTEEPSVGWLTGIPVHTDLELTGTFECSDEQVNRLHAISVHTMLCNLLGVPTDCPQREKCGWLGDTHAYAAAANLNFDMLGFWSKYLADIRTGGSDPAPNTLFHERGNNEFYWADKAPGIPYMIAPGKRLCGVASPDWGTALVQLPWYLYVYYGDNDILEEYYGLMKQWTDRIASTAVDNIVYQGLGDWCPPGNNRAIDTPIEFTSTAFHYLDLTIMQKTAAVLGKTDDAARFEMQRQDVRAAIMRKFYHPFKKSFGSQTADAMALDLGLAPDGDRAEIAASLVRQIDRNGGFFHMGIFGLCRAGGALSRNGRSAEAWSAFTKKGDRSFGYMLNEVGATTLWEELPVYSERAQRAGRSSRSHPMQGGYDAWFYEDIAGIRPDESDPGFRTVIFDPQLTGQLD